MTPKMQNSPQLTAERNNKKDDRIDLIVTPSVILDQANIGTDISSFTPEQRAEFKASAIDDGIIALNFKSIPEGTEAYQYLMYSDSLKRSNTGRLEPWVLRKYPHIQNGGVWFDAGVDVVNGEDFTQYGCFKPKTPRVNADNNKPIKYENPLKERARLFLLKLPLYIWEAIAQQNGVDLPSDYKNMRQVELWQWAINDTRITKVWCEGVKKAACLLSCGFLAIGINGIWGAYSGKDDDGEKLIGGRLLPDALIVAIPDSKHIFCFDNDPNPETKESVARAIRCTSKLMEARGCKVRVADTSRFGEFKGVDDFVFAMGSEAVKAILNHTERVESWYENEVASEQDRISRLDVKKTWKEIEVNSRYLSDQAKKAIKNFGLYLIVAGMGSGKTRLVSEIIKEHPNRPILTITPTEGLGREQANQFGIPYRTDISKEGSSDTSKAMTLSNYNRVSLCCASLHQARIWVQKNKLRYPILILDEVEQMLNFLIESELCNKNYKRTENIKALVDLLEEAEENRVLIIACDAGMTNISVDFLTHYTKNLPVTVIRSTFSSKLSKVHFVKGKKNNIDKKLVESLSKKKKVCIACDSQGEAEAQQKTLEELIPEIKILRIDSSTGGDPEVQEAIINPNEAIALRGYDAIIYTTTVGSGWSVTLSKEMASAYQKVSKLEATEEEESLLIAKEELKIAEQQWEFSTPYFDEKFVYNTHLVADLVLQMSGRFRFATPMYTWVGKDLKTGECDSPLPFGQRRHIKTKGEDVTELLIEARQKALAESEIDHDEALSETEVIRHFIGLMLENNPTIKLLSENRARRVYMSENRATKLRETFAKRGYEIDDIELDDDDDSPLTELGAKYKEEKEERIALTVVTSKVISDEEKKILEQKTFPTEEEKCKLKRKLLEERLPGFLEEIEEDSRAIYYQKGHMDFGGKKVQRGLENWAAYLYQDQVAEKQLHEFFINAQKCYESGIGAYHGVSKAKNNLGMIKFVKQSGLFGLIEFDNCEKSYTKDYFEPLIRELFESEKARAKKRKVENRFKTYFNKGEPTTRIMQFMNDVLAKFSWIFVKDCHGKTADSWKLKRMIVPGMTPESEQRMMEILKDKYFADAQETKEKQEKQRERDRLKKEAEALQKETEELIQEAMENPGEQTVLSTVEVTVLNTVEGRSIAQAGTISNQPQVKEDADWLSVLDEQSAKPEMTEAKPGVQEAPIGWKGTNFVISSDARLEQELHREIAARSLVGRGDSEPVKVMNQWRVWVTFPNKGCQQIPCDALVAV